MLGDDHARNGFQHFARAQNGAAFEQFCPHHALRSRVARADGVIVMAIAWVANGDGWQFVR